MVGERSYMVGQQLQEAVLNLLMGLAQVRPQQQGGTCGRPQSKHEPNRGGVDAALVAVQLHAITSVSTSCALMHLGNQSCMCLCCGCRILASHQLC